MRHGKARYQLNRFTSWRRATLRSLARNLLIQESIRTTKTRAKAAQPLVEKLISLGKQNTLAARRRAFQILCDHKLVQLLFNDIAKRFEKRQSGFSRILHLDSRRGDNASMVLFELVERKKKEAKKPKKEKEPKAHEEKPQAPGEPHEKPTEEEKPKRKVALKEKPPLTQKPQKKFFGGLRNIFKKERDSL